MRVVAVFAIFCLLNAASAKIDRVRAVELFKKVKKTALVRKNPNLIERVRKRILRRGCGTNICFVLDGSSPVGTANFELQKQFVTLIAAITGADDTAMFAAADYDVFVENISGLTIDAANFIRDVGEAPFPDSPNSFLSVGLGFCFSETENFDSKEEVNKVVLFADGESNFGDLDAPIFPLPFAQFWRDLEPQSNSICAVAVGSSIATPLEDITGDPGRVLRIKDWSKRELLNILDTLVEQICFK